MKLLFLKLKDKYWWNCLFFFLILTIYIISWIIDFNFFINTWEDFIKILINQILLILIIVFLFMFFLNIILEKEVIKEKIKNSKNSTKYLFSIIGWIFSTWPVYMWYPFLKKLKNSWLNYGHIATFIYARAVKIPFFAAMIFYFWLKYTIIFNIVLVFSALIIWILINLIFNFLDYEKNNSQFNRVK